MIQHTEIVKPRDLQFRLDMWIGTGAQIEKELLSDGNWLLTITFPEEPSNRNVNDPNPADTPNPTDPSEKIGVLSAKFESGGRSSSAIGEDSTGGPSYGKYQIATKTGTFESFMKFLESEAPDINSRLSDAGGSDAALKKTQEFQDAWRAEAARGSALTDAEHAFIKATHYSPHVDRLNSIGLHVTRRSNALKNVVWSVAVQHGPKNNVIKNALDALGDPQELSDKVIITEIYRERSNTSKYFSKSTPKVKKAVKNRFKEEKIAALEMLKKEQT